MNLVNDINKNNILPPDNIDGLDTPKGICEMFSDKYKSILNKNPKSTTSKFRKLNLSEKQKQLLILRFSEADVKRAISQLNTGIGFDAIHSWHLKLCPPVCLELISMLFFSFIVHNHIPVSMLHGVITPIVKDPLKDIESSDNYRPVMSSSVFLKLLEYCILYKIEPNISLMTGSMASELIIPPLLLV